MLVSGIQAATSIARDALASSGSSSAVQARSLRDLTTRCRAAPTDRKFLGGVKLRVDISASGRAPAPAMAGSAETHAPAAMNASAVVFGEVHHERVDLEEPRGATYVVRCS